jgi:hypothetical protein
MATDSVAPPVVCPAVLPVPVGAACTAAPALDIPEIALGPPTAPDSDATPVDAPLATATPTTDVDVDALAVDVPASTPTVLPGMPSEKRRNAPRPAGMPLDYLSQYPTSIS